jgi:hypothetical protein
MDNKTNRAIIKKVLNKFIRLKYRVHIGLTMTFSSFRFHAVGILDNIKAGNFKGIVYQIRAINEGWRLKRLFKQGKTVEEVRNFDNIGNKK